MSDQLLFLLKLCLLALLYLFFFRVLRAVWAELRAPSSVAASAGGPPPAQAGAAAAPPRTEGRLPPVPVPPPPASHQLVVVDPPEGAGQVFQLGPEVTVGRAPGCQVCVDDSFTSQVHARVFSRDGAWYLEDMGSTNGTFLNEQRVGAPAAIRPGDRFRVGGTTFELR